MTHGLDEHDVPHQVKRVRRTCVKRSGRPLDVEFDLWGDFLTAKELGREGRNSNSSGLR